MTISAIILDYRILYIIGFSDDVILKNDYIKGLNFFKNRKIELFIPEHAINRLIRAITFFRLLNHVDAIALLGKIMGLFEIKELNATEYQKELFLIMTETWDFNIEIAYMAAARSLKGAYIWVENFPNFPNHRYPDKLDYVVNTDALDGLLRVEYGDKDIQENFIPRRNIVNKGAYSINSFSVSATRQERDLREAYDLMHARVKKLVNNNFALKKIPNMNSIFELLEGSVELSRGWLPSIIPSLQSPIDELKDVFFSLWDEIFDALTFIIEQKGMACGSLFEDYLNLKNNLKNIPMSEWKNIGFGRQESNLGKSSISAPIEGKLNASRAMLKAQDIPRLNYSAGGPSFGKNQVCALEGRVCQFPAGSLGGGIKLYEPSPIRISRTSLPEKRELHAYKSEKDSCALRLAKSAERISLFDLTHREELEEISRKYPAAIYLMSWRGMGADFNVIFSFQVDVLKFVRKIEDIQESFSFGDIFRLHKKDSGHEVKAKNVELINVGKDLYKEMLEMKVKKTELDVKGITLPGLNKLRQNTYSIVDLINYGLGYDCMKGHENFAQCFSNLFTFEQSLTSAIEINLKTLREKYGIRLPNPKAQIKAFEFEYLNGKNFRIRVTLKCKECGTIKTLTVLRDKIIENNIKHKKKNYSEKCDNNACRGTFIIQYNFSFAEQFLRDDEITDQSEPMLEGIDLPSEEIIQPTVRRQQKVSKTRPVQRGIPRQGRTTEKQIKKHIPRSAPERKQRERKYQKPIQELDKKILNALKNGPKKIVDLTFLLKIWGDNNINVLSETLKELKVNEIIEMDGRGMFGLKEKKVRKEVKKKLGWKYR